MAERDPGSNAIDVLVVGAGPTGLTMAAELARHGLRCRLIDKRDGPLANSRALAIQARTLELFDLMGVVDPFLTSGCQVRGGSYWAGDQRLAHAEIKGLDTPYPFLLDLPQNQTEAILRQHLAQYEVQPEWGVELTAFSQESAGVTATLRRSTGAEETIDVPWLIGCDGAHSTTRHTVGWDFGGSTMDALFAVGDMRIDWPLPHAEMKVFLHEAGLLSAFPFGVDRHRVVVELEPFAGEGRPPDPTLADFQRWFAERGPAGATVADPDWMTNFRVSFRHAPHLRQGRVFLAGDAAHIHSPAGGQGMNTCIQDAINLAWKLALVQRGLAADALLDSYEIERKPVAEDVLRYTQAIGRVAATRGERFNAIRTKVLPVVLDAEFVQKRMANWLSELTINYRRSPIVAHDASGRRRRTLRGPRPGDRALDAPLVSPDGEQRRLFDLLRHPQHTLLLFTGTAPAVERQAWTDATAAVAREHGDLVRLARVAVTPDRSNGDARAYDPDLIAHRRYGAEQGGLYLIRPDGYVAFRATPPDGPALTRYLSSIFVADLTPGRMMAGNVPAKS